MITVPASVAAAGSALRDRRRRLVAPGLGDRVIVEFAAADDVRSGMARVVAMLRRGGGAGRVEWWSPADNSSSLRLEVADGHGRGRRVAVPAGPAGVVIVVAGGNGPQLSAAVRRLAPVLRRRWTEERLAQQAVQLARHNQALGDFAALVAHELKTPLELARRQHDPSAGVERALELVDVLLEAAWAESASQGCASAADCLDEALRDLGPIAAEVPPTCRSRFRCRRWRCGSCCATWSPTRSRRAHGTSMSGRSHRPLPAGWSSTTTGWEWRRLRGMWRAAGWV